MVGTQTRNSMNKPPEFNGLSAIVVEDKAPARLGYAATLVAHGFEVETAENVGEAKEKLRNRFFDMAWVDLGLEESEIFTGLEGRDVIEYIMKLGDPTFVMGVTVVD